MPTPRDKLDPGAMRNPYSGAAAVTPSDAADLPRAPTRALFVGGSGTVVVTMEDGSANVLFTVQAGVLPLRVTRVWATGTTPPTLPVVALY
jgi:hypothetical protein